MMNRMYQTMGNRKFDFSRFIGWGKLITITGSAQMLVQGIGLLSGILIVRLLPTREYALYTLANTMLGTMSVLADGGISSGVMAIGGRVWQDRRQLGSVVSTGLQLRRQFAVYSLLISMPILFYLLMHHGAGLLFSFLIILALIPAFYAALSDNLLEIAPKLNQDIPRLQKNQLVTAIGRLFMITSSLLFFPFTFIAILGNGVPRMWANLQLRKISSRYADHEQKVDPAFKKDILVIVRRTLPGAVYFCFSGQITIWLISIFGSTTSVAQIGAISRLTVVFTLFTTLFSTLVVPRFARLPENPNIIKAKFLQIQLAVFFIGIITVGLVYVFPAQILWLLGKDYKGLTVEVIMISISAALAMISGVTYSAMIARGWIIKSVIYVPVNICFQILLVLFLDLSKTTNVLIFSIIDSLLGFIILIIYFIYCFNKLKRAVT